MEAHGGKIWAENNADGIGATFAFSLPLSKCVGPYTTANQSIKNRKNG